MTDLIAKRPLDGLDEIFGETAGNPARGTRLRALNPGRVTSIAPYPGRDASPALAPLGLRFPPPGALIASGGARIAWAGRQMAFLIGADAPEGLAPLAALTDQSDGWAWLELSGPAAPAVLARLCPLDLRAQSFPQGSAARSMIGHMSALILRPDAETFELAVFASMAATARHELAAAARALAARSEIAQ